MAVNKVKYGSTTIIDISDTTAEASDVASGKYFYGKDGVKTQGTASGGSSWKVAQFDQHPAFDTAVFNIGDIGEPTAYILYSDITRTNLYDGIVVALVHDSTRTKAYTYMEGNVEEVDFSGYSPTISNGIVEFASYGDYFFSTPNYGDGYKLICVYGGTGSFSFRSATYNPPSGVHAGQFAVEEMPVLYFCGLSANYVALNQYHRVQTVVKSSDEDVFCGTNFYTGTLGFYTDFTESFSNGTLTITSSGNNAGGYFHNPETYYLFYALEEDIGGIPLQSKTVTPDGTTQVVTADSGYEGLRKVTVNPIPSEYIIPSGNKEITQNGTGIDVASYATVSVAVPSSGSANVGTLTKSNSSNTATSLTFTGLQGTPKWFFVRCQTQIQSSGSTSYYYVDNFRYNGTNHNGTYVRIGSTRGIYPDTTHYNHSYSNGTLTLTTSGSRTGAGGSFYNGTYELVYIY